MDTQHPIAVLAHEPGEGWITFAVVGTPQLANLAELDAIDAGYDAVVIA